MQNPINQNQPFPFTKKKTHPWIRPYVEAKMQKKHTRPHRSVESVENDDREKYAAHNREINIFLQPPGAG